MTKEYLNDWLQKRLRGDPLAGLQTQSNDLQFVMEANGYVLSKDGTWRYNQDARLRNSEFFNLSIGIDFNTRQIFNKGDDLAEVLNRKSILDVIRGYRRVDDEQAKLISFLYSGIFGHVHVSQVAQSLEFAAQMTSLGGKKSGEAIAAATTMYLITGGSYEEVNPFQKNVYYMAEAIDEDPVTLKETEDLGLSQALRLQSFLGKVDLTDNLSQTYPEQVYTEAFSGFPTIGGEFHLFQDSETFPNFWQRIALLNMSQYQRESKIPFSRTDKGLIEIRMNPSIYPVAVSTWNLMRLILPELNNAYFSMTLNRRDRDFLRSKDKDLVLPLHALGELCFAAHHRDFPFIEDKAELAFGERYIGQTVRVKDGVYSLTGSVQKGQGQLNICSGFGKMFPDMAKYLSMGTAEPTLLESIRRSKIGKEPSLTNALKMDEEAIKYLFKRMNEEIMIDPGLRRANELGEKIINRFSP